MTEEKNSLIRRFAITDWAVNNRVTVGVLTVIILIAGLMSYRAMPAESFPEITQPTIYVGTPYPGNSPVDIERLITRPLEKELNSVSGINKITSSSVQGYSSIHHRTKPQEYLYVLVFSLHSSPFMRIIVSHYT